MYTKRLGRVQKLPNDSFVEFNFTTASAWANAGELTSDCASIDPVAIFNCDRGWKNQPAWRSQEIVL
jgi:hypothetical protein